jgi:hypothetical protein
VEGIFPHLTSGGLRDREAHRAIGRCTGWRGQRRGGEGDGEAGEEDWDVHKMEGPPMKRSGRRTGWNNGETGRHTGRRGGEGDAPTAT